MHEVTLASKVFQATRSSLLRSSCIRLKDSCFAKEQAGMDLEYFAKFLDIITISGSTLNIEKNHLLQSSLTLLLNDNHFKKVYFWGKIFGLDSDYYIAFGYRRDILREARYYFSKNAVNWEELPRPEPEEYMKCKLATSNRFIGDADYKLDIVDTDPTGMGFPREPLKVEERNLYWRKYKTYPSVERVRLAATVRYINIEGMAVPRGALYKQQNGDVVSNNTWSGMSYEDSKILGNYHHFRTPFNYQDENVTKRLNYNYAYDFMDPIDVDIPLNFAWTCQAVDTNRVACLRSLYWPGAVSYNVLESRMWGFLYFGPAQRSIDTPFMI